MTYFIPCKYACVLKRPAESDLESSTYNLRLSEKEMFSFSFQEKRCRKKLSPDWSPQESFINCLGNLFQGYHVNQNFMVKKKNSEKLAILVLKRKGTFL